MLESRADNTKGYFFTNETTYIEELPRGIHRWFSRFDVTGCENLIMAQVDVEPGGGHPFHYHPDMDEVIYILSGQAEQWIEKKKKILGPGEAIYVPKKVVHSTYNCGEETLKFLAILSPAKDLEGSMVYVHEEEPWKSLMKPF